MLIHAAAGGVGSAAAQLDLPAPFGRVAVYGEAARHPDLALPVLPLWKNNRALTGYHIGDLSRRAPETPRRHALTALSPAGSEAVRRAASSASPTFSENRSVRSAPSCDRAYVDTSRDGTRRFCSTACQNRVKAAAHRARQRQ